MARPAKSDRRQRFREDVKPKPEPKKPATKPSK